MLAIDERETVFALRQLLEDKIIRQRPLLLWVGAGASAWAHYPLWKDLAGAFHLDFSRYAPSYPRGICEAFLREAQYPAVFQVCREIDSRRYSTLLTRAFEPKPLTPVYQRFLRALRGSPPLRVLTTNVDELLEQNLPDTIVVQRSDLERCVKLAQGDSSFVAKIHGSVSQIDSVVFTTSDYAQLAEDDRYLTLLSHLIRNSTVVFIGSSLADDYLLNLLASNDSIMKIFGDGPHFLIGSASPPNLPDSIKVIRYQPDPHRGHRAPLQVFEALQYSRMNSEVGFESQSSATTQKLRSAHFIADIHPPGRPWTTSTTTRLDASAAGFTVLLRGYGFAGREIPATSTALHDVLVSLLCFDITYVPLQAVGRMIYLLGDKFFAELLRNKAIQFLYWDAEEGVPFADARNYWLWTFDVSNSPS